MERTKNLTCFFLLFLLFVACNGAGHKVHEAEEVMEKEPETALQILKDIEKPEENLSRKDYALYSLLVTQAMDKCDMDLSEDSLIANAIDYYRTSKDSAQAAKAYFYGAMVANATKNKPQAVEYYLKAKDLLAHNNNPKFQFLVRYYLGEVYSSQWLNEEQLEVNKEAVHYAESYGDSVYLALAYYDLGLAYSALHEVDSALIHQKKALDISQNHCSSLLPNIYYHLWLSYRDTGDRPQATLFADKLYETSTNEALANSVRGRNYHLNNKPDSALLYLRKALDTDKLYLKSTTYIALADLFSSIHLTDSASFYLREHIATRDSLDKAIRATVVIETKNQSKQNRLTEENLYLKERDLINTRIILSLATAIFMGLIITSISYLWYKRRKERYRKEREELLIQKEKQELIHENHLLQLRHELYKLINYETMPHLNQNEYKITDRDWTLIFQHTNLLFDNFTIRIAERHPKISPTDIRLCCLIKMELDNKTIGQILNLEEKSIMKRKYRLWIEKIEGSDQNTLEEYIRKM